LKIFYIETNRALITKAKYSIYIQQIILLYIVFIIIVFYLW